MGIDTKAAWLGYGGLIPFAVALGGVVFDGAFSPLALQALLAYGAVILSFIGAVHWGIALSKSEQLNTWLLPVSVVPSLLGWVSLLLPASAALALQIVTFLGLYAYERAVIAPVAFPAWYQTLRLHLTTGVVTMLLVALVVVSAR